MTDEANKQYLKLSVVLAFLLSFIVNFFFFGLISGPFFGGFPISVDNASGAGEILSRLINTIIMGALMIVPTYYFLQWVLRKSGGGI